VTFVAAIILVPLITTSVYVYVILPTWLDNPAVNFQNIKTVPVRYGIISQADSENLSSSSITDDKPYSRWAVSLIEQDLHPLGLFLRVGVPVLVVIILFIVFALRVEVPGITKDFPYRGILAEKTMDHVSDLTRAIITVDGFIIGLLGSALVSSGLNNFYFFLGFETIIISLISSLASYPSFIRAGTLKAQEKGREKEEDPLFKLKLEKYFRFINFASWSLILGLVLLATSFS